MIHRTELTVQALSWQQQLSHTVKDVHELLELVELSPSQLKDTPVSFDNPFPIRVPRSFIHRMQPGNIDDPLLKQVLPVMTELSDQPGYQLDPLNEQLDASPKGLIHKYKSRILLILTGACAINCRYCFRRHYPYQDNTPDRQQWEKALDYIRQTPSINEVIYSGGDPLAMSDKQLMWLTSQIADIPHVTKIRVHSRLPIMIPERICHDMIAWLTGTRLKPIMVVHCNHPNELNSSALKTGLQKLTKHHVTLLNQAVLLKGINDDVNTLSTLSNDLFELNIMPYYLHLLDAVAGAAHFDVSIDAAKQLYVQLCHELPGYLVPKLVKEIPGCASKTQIPHADLHIHQ